MRNLYKIFVPILLVMIIISTVIIIIKLRATEDIDIPTSAQISRLEDTIEDGDGTTFLRIEADIIGNDTDSFPVVSLLRYDFTEDDIKAYADSFFDNSEYHNQPYAEEYSVSYIDKIIDQLNGYKEDIIENKPSIVSDADYSNIISFIDRDIDYYINLKTNAPTDSLLRCDTTYDPCYTYEEYLEYSGSETPNPELENRFMDCSLEGSYGNVPYTLVFNKTDSAKTTSFTINLNSPDTVVWKNFTYEQVTYDPYQSQLYGRTPSSIPNPCVYTEEDAIRLCDSMIRQLGIQDMSVINISNLSTKAYLNRYLFNYWLDMGECGYYISYGKTVNDKSLNYLFSGSPGELFLEGTDELVPGSESLSFIVMDSGIVSMEYYAPTVIDSISTDSTPLLSFDDILLIFEDQMIEIYGNEPIYKMESGNLVVSKIQLGLSLVTTDAKKGEYTLVPAWTFYNYDNWGLITINAIDGSTLQAN